MPTFSIIPDSFTAATTATRGQPVCSAIVKNTAEAGILALGIIDTITGELIGWGESESALQTGKQAKVDMMVTGDILSPNLRFIVGYIENGEFKITDKVDFQVALLPAVPAPNIIPILIIVGLIFAGMYLISKSK